MICESVPDTPLTTDLTRQDLDRSGGSGRIEIVQQVLVV